MNPAEWDGFLAAYLDDGSLPAAARAIELSDEQTGELLDLVELDGLLAHRFRPDDAREFQSGLERRIEAESTRGSFARRVDDRLRSRKRRRFLLWGGLAAAGLLAGLVALLFPAREQETPLAVLERAEGVVTRVDGAARARIGAGEGIAAGQALETDGTGRATIRYGDGTRVQLGVATQVRGFETSGGKRFFVARGSVRAEVVPQPAGQAMTVRTAEGEARVVGTAFALEARPGSTRLEVERGLVRLTRLSDRKSADVAAGQFATASPAEEPVARPVPRPRDPGLLSRMAPGTWLSIPDTRMRGVTPDPAKYPAIRGQSGPESVVLAWSGGALDTRRNRLVLWGGGFTSYYGNELYAFDVGRLAWERLTEPTAVPALAQQVNADGTPNARATYNGLAYIDHADRFFASGGDLARVGREKMPLADITWTFDFATKTWTNRNPSGARPPTFVMNLCSYDPGTRKVWWAESNSGAAGLYSYDYDANAWTRHTSEPFGRQTSAVDTRRGRLVMVGEGQVIAYDLGRPNPERETWRTTGGEALVAAASPGLDYDPVADRIVGWAGGAVYALDPGTKAWTAHDAPGAPLPTAVASREYLTGIYGRWRYVPAAKAFILMTSIDVDVHFFKLPQ